MPNSCASEVNNELEGVEFDFAEGGVQQLLPGQHVLVVEDREAFQFRYGADLPVAGQWQGGLSQQSRAAHTAG